MQTALKQSITFKCPECDALLRVPLEKAGISGPCPNCRNEIQSPQKDTKDETELERAYRRRHQLTGFQPNEIIRKDSSGNNKNTEPDKVQKQAENGIPKSSNKGHSKALMYTISILIVIGSAFISYKLWTNDTNPTISPQMVSKSVAGNLSIISEPKPDKEINTLQKNKTLVLDEAKINLEKFLEAETVNEKSRYILNAEKLLPRIIEYYQKYPEPLAYSFLPIDQNEVTSNKESNFRIFDIVTKTQSLPFPVFLENTNKGWKVNWESFVQYNTNSLGQFLEQPQSGEKEFYVKIERSHYFGSEIPKLGSKICFKIDPIVSSEGYVFAERASPVAEYNEQELEWGEIYFPIVRLEWINSEQGQPYVRIIEFIQKTWISPKGQALNISSTKTRDSLDKTTVD